MTTDTSIRVTCDARTGEAPGDYSMVPIWCNTARGLRTYTDNHGAIRRYCAAHEAAVRGRYPEAEPESADGITQAKYRDELMEGVAHFEWHGHDIEVEVI